MKHIEIRNDSPYGTQHDMHLNNVRIRLTEKTNELRIFFGDGIPPVYVPKDSAMYHQLIKQFKQGE